MRKRTISSVPFNYPRRRGAAIILMTIMLSVLIVLAAITIDLGYIQLLRTEQKVATDLASKAAAEALVRTESEDEAIAAAHQVAALHRVGTRQFGIATSNIEFGHATELEGGSFDFEVGVTPLNSARVTSDIGSGLDGEMPSIAMLFRGSGHADYRGSAVSVSTFIINDVVLCLDRSGSMKFDMSGDNWKYPQQNPHVPLPYRNYIVDSTGDPGFWEHYYAPPHPSGSRWAKLVSAIDLFLDEAGNTAEPPRVGLVTWSSNHADDGTATGDYPLPSDETPWSSNRNSILQALTSRAGEDDTDGVYGGTLMADGMSRGLSEFETENSRGMANKVMILLTDGLYQGSDPYEVALNARDADVTIHCISLLDGNTFAKAQQIAAVTGGDAYMATDEEQLRQAFFEIARSLKLILTR